MTVTGKKFIVALSALIVILGVGWWVLQMRPPLPSLPQSQPLPVVPPVFQAQPLPVDPSEPKPDPRLLRELSVSLQLLSDSLSAGKDPRAAIVMLGALESRVAEAPAKTQLAALRQALLADKQRLESVTVPDLVKMKSVLLQMRASVDQLPNVFVPSSGQGSVSVAQSQTASAEQSYWGRIGSGLLESLARVVQVRRVEDRQASFRTPEQGRMLTEQLRFRLEIATLALEARNAAALARELASAQAILAQGFDADSAAVIEFRSQLVELQAASAAIAMPMPEASLRALEPLVSGAAQ